MTDKQKGYLGEEIAAEHLRSKGYEILDLNYTIKGGELDIVARDGETLVFVEVKARTGTEYLAAEAVDRRKCERLIKSAEKYVLDKSEIASDMKARFDYIEIYFGTDKNSAPTVNHYKNIIY